MRMLDQDLYKLTMQQAIWRNNPDAEAQYELIVRSPVIWPGSFRNLYREIERLLVENMATLSNGEYAWLKGRLPFLSGAYLDFLSDYRFNMDEVIECERSVDGKELRLVVRGPWYRTVLWEVPLMALISELYHRETTGQPDEQCLAEVAKRAEAKRKLIDGSGIHVVEGGTRRRHSYDVHKQVLKILKIPTSNVALAMDFALPCVGTVAHEWFMFHGAIFGYRGANRLALQRWVATYQGQLGVALMDTYTTEAFLKDFDPLMARIYDGVRQDSGDPIAIAEKVIEHYKALGIDPRSKFIVFSDGLNVERAAHIRDVVSAWIGAKFLIGTDLTCDVPGVKPLNMVIKMTRCRLNENEPWMDTVKLSDVPTKHTGSEEEIVRCKKELKIG